MKTLFFEIAKKMPRAVKCTPGMSLRSIRMDAAAGEAAMVIMADSYELVKAQLADRPLRYRSQGKTLSIFEGAASGPAGEQLFAFASVLPFNTEEALDVCEFLSLPDKPFDIEYLELSGTSFSAKCRAQLDIADAKAEGQDEKSPEAAEAAEAFFGSISGLLSRYTMGVIKQAEA